MSRSLRAGQILIAVHNGPEVIPVCLALHRKSGRATLWALEKRVVVRLSSANHGYRVRLEDICHCLTSARPSTLRAILTLKAATIEHCPGDQGTHPSSTMSSITSSTMSAASIVCRPSKTSSASST
jgi:hypothetical protein